MPELKAGPTEVHDDAQQRSETSSAAEVLSRQAERMDAFFRRKQERWDALSPAEQAAEEAAHEQVMRSIDERQRRSRGIVDTAGAA